jgi:hypothetical protein
LRTDGPVAVEASSDGDWFVRPITATAAGKAYRCPGCDHEIAAGVAHVVAWRSGEEEHRRHWHRPCWQHRDRRRVGRG